MTTLRCISPIDGSVLAERPALAPEEAAAAVDRARAAQRGWAARPLQDRVELVRAGVERLGAMNDEAVPELARMMGRPVRYGGEFGGVAERAEHMARIAPEALEPSVIADDDRFRRVLKREPHGVVLVVAPWNYPYLTATNTIVPALIAGNAVVLKHATQTLLAGERLVRAFVEAGVPEDVFLNVFLDHATTERLLGRGAFDFVNFTGSVAGGQAIERAAAGTFTALGLELGGKDPGYVMEDADLASAIAVLMDGAMYNSGQCCCGIERVYVHRSLYDEFVDGAVAEARKLRLGDPLDPDTTLGPMANRRFADGVRAQVEAAVAAGATAHLPRLQADDGGTYLSPQILTGVTREMAVMREESFGPVVGIMPVAGDDEALELMNDSAYGLTASLWTADPERAEALGARIETGTVFQNRADYVDPGLCWTGCKLTGRGGAMGFEGYRNLTRPKSYHLRKAMV